MLMSLRGLGFGLTLAAILAVVVSFHTDATAQNQKNQKYSSGPPTLSPTVEPNVIKACAGDGAKVRLTANARSANNAQLKYKWNVSSGHITGDGDTPVWDLSGVAPGVYVANVEVGDSLDPGCVSFSSVPVVVLDCPPPPPVCPTVAIECPEAVKEGDQVTFKCNLTGGTAGITPSYVWTVSTGQIISGQGTPTIVVDSTGMAGQTLRANVDVQGFGTPCPATDRKSVVEGTRVGARAGRG